MDFVLLLFAVLPGLLVCWFIYKMDKYEKESPLHLYLSFSLGMLVTLPVMKLEEWTHQAGVGEVESFWFTLFSSFIIVAFSEELVKFLALIWYPYRKVFFNEPIDGIIYAVMISMGFATLENILYAYRFGIETLILRAFTAIPAHAAFAVIMGYFVGKAKFQPEKRRQYLFFALSLPILIHGVYDFFILQEAYDWLILLAVPTLALSIHFAWRLIRIQQENSPFKE